MCRIEEQDDRTAALVLGKLDHLHLALKMVLVRFHKSSDSDGHVTSICVNYLVIKFVIFLLTFDYIFY
jgi:hypothetical protein